MEHLNRRRFFGVLAGGAAALRGVEAEAHIPPEAANRSNDYATELEDLFIDLATGDGQGRDEQKEIFEEKFAKVTEQFLSDFARLSGKERSPQDDARALKDAHGRVETVVEDRIVCIQIKVRLEREISKSSRKR